MRKPCVVSVATTAVVALTATTASAEVLSVGRVGTPLSTFWTSTILDTTFGDVRAEIALRTVLDGHESLGRQPIADPFANFGGTWYQHQAGGVNAAVTVVPAPASAALIGFGGLAMARRRR
ncbi:MAG: hypothetical protein AAFR76_10465 [Planctomycetota bacterium]